MPDSPEYRLLQALDNLREVLDAFDDDETQDALDLIERRLRALNRQTEGR